MALPSGVKTAVVTVGPPNDFSGVVIEGVTVTITPSTSVIWSANGTPLFPKPIVVTLDDAGNGSCILVITDQDGFVDGKGNTIRDWTYQAQWSFPAGVTNPKPFTFQLLDGQTEVDLDMLLPVTSSQGVVVERPAVTSVNGQTGDVEIAVLSSVQGNPPDENGNVDVSDKFDAIGAADAVRASALLKAMNLADLADASTALANLGGAALDALNAEIANRQTDTTTLTNAINDVSAAWQAGLASFAAGLSPKPPVKVVASSNITLPSLPVIDGYQVQDGDRVLLPVQTNGIDDGIWIAHSGRPWERPTDYAVGAHAEGVTVYVEGGTTQKSSTWGVSGAGPYVIGTNATSWVQITGLGEVTVASPITKNGNQLGFDPTTLAKITGALQATDLRVLPTPTAGAAGKVATVKADGSGYELDDIVIPTGLTSKGTYNAASTYAFGDIVTDAGGTRWLCLSAYAGTTPVFVGYRDFVQQTASASTVAMPAGSAAGDLAVFVFAQSSYTTTDTAPTLPDGMSIIGQVIPTSSSYSQNGPVVVATKTLTTSDVTSGLSIPAQTNDPNYGYAGRLYVMRGAGGATTIPGGKDGSHFPLLPAFTAPTHSWLLDVVSVTTGGGNPNNTIMGSPGTSGITAFGVNLVYNSGGAGYIPTASQIANAYFDVSAGSTVPARDYAIGNGAVATTTAPTIGLSVVVTVGSQTPPSSSFVALGGNGGGQMIATVKGTVNASTNVTSQTGIPVGSITFTVPSSGQVRLRALGTFWPVTNYPVQVYAGLAAGDSTYGTLFDLGLSGTSVEMFSEGSVLINGLAPGTQKTVYVTIAPYSGNTAGNLGEWAAVSIEVYAA